MQASEIRERFKCHEVFAFDKKDAIENCHEAFAVLAMQIEEACGDGREKALAMTKLEESLHWTIKAIIRAREKAGA